MTVTIGGNDLGFSHVLQHCFTHRDCMNDVFDDSFDDGSASGLTLRTWASQRLAKLETDVGDLLTRIRSGAPSARVLVLGYPNLLWSHLPDVQSGDCLADVVLLDGSEANDILGFQSELSRAIDAVAAASGVEFIDTAPVFRDHEPCGAITPRWLDYIVPGDSRQTPLDPGTFHPNRNGHYILARLISCYLSLNPTPTDTYDVAAAKDCAIRGR